MSSTAHHSWLSDQGSNLCELLEFELKMLDLYEDLLEVDLRFKVNLCFFLDVVVVCFELEENFFFINNLF